MNPFFIYFEVQGLTVKPKEGRDAILTQDSKISISRDKLKSIPNTWNLFKEN